MDIWDHVNDISKEFIRLMKIKNERIKQNRIKAQNNSFTKARKSRAMKEYWKRKKEQEQREKEKQKLIDKYVPDSCYCHTIPMPPCGFCESAKYCENCDEITTEDECSKCGKILV